MGRNKKVEAYRRLVGAVIGRAGTSLRMDFAWRKGTTIEDHLP